MTKFTLFKAISCLLFVGTLAANAAETQKPKKCEGATLASVCAHPAAKATRLDAVAMTAAAGDAVLKTELIDGQALPVWIFAGDKNAAVAVPLPEMPKDARNFSVSADIAPLASPKSVSAEAVFRATLFQTETATQKVVNRLSGVPVRVRIAATPRGCETVELESCYTPIQGLPVTLQIERKTDDSADTFDGAVALCAARIVPVGARPAFLPVAASAGYNSWPFVQALGDTLVCAYSRGSAHDIYEGRRNAYVRTSADGGKTWSPEHTLFDDDACAETPESKGLDANGDMLLWVSFDDRKNRAHKLYRTQDGLFFKLIASPKLDPIPMQITGIFAVPEVGLMALWFTGNYGENARNAWGTLVSNDNGATWTQQTVESGLDSMNWTTEPSAVYLGDGKILGIGRIEHTTDATEKAQFQLESRDSGRTWTRTRTNITDVCYSTPSLIYDKNTGLIAHYYFQRGRGLLKRRVVAAERIFGNPLAWPAPEVLAFASESVPDSGNANATVRGDTHCIAYYSGDAKNTQVVLSCVKAPRKISSE